MLDLILSTLVESWASKALGMLEEPAKQYKEECKTNSDMDAELNFFYEVEDVGYFDTLPLLRVNLPVYCGFFCRVMMWLNPSVHSPNWVIKLLCWFSWIFQREEYLFLKKPTLLRKPLRKFWLITKLEALPSSP